MKRGDLYSIYRISAIREGVTVYRRSTEKAKVMGVIDGWAMLRFKGCVPFIESAEDLEKWAACAPWPLEESRTACKRCGGSGSVDLSREPCSTATMDCPDCDGKGNGIDYGE